MHKRGALLILLVLSLCTASASTISEEMQRLTHYAEEYETGNVNYLQLMVHISAVKEGLNELMGVKSKEEGGILKQEQLKSILGDPAEETKWVWVEKEEREMKLGNSVPIWKKIVFDGKKIQVRLAAYPSILQKKDLSSAKSEKLETFEDLGDGKYLAYRLNFETEFKKEGQQLNVQEKIEDIKALAGTYNADPSQANGEALAKESVNVEKSFESYFRQSGEKCEDILASIFGSENKRKLEKMIVWEIDFYEGDNFLARTRLEMCDECGGNWINLDTWIEGRGPGFKGIEGTMESSSPDEFMTLSDESFEAKTRELLEDSKRAIEKKEWPEFNRIKSRIWSLNEAWNRKSNDVWKEIDAVYEEERKSMSEEERRKFEENYGWLKQEQEKRAKVKETQTANYQKRKAFYESLFSSYEKKEYFYEQVGFEKRLIEEFREFGEEVCDNNQDDNNNGNIDCADEQCGGKICGYSTVAIAGSNNETHEEEKEMYCIMGSCQVKEEIIEMKNESICGNHLCELGEKESNCTQDCAMCPTYDPINCSGKVIFSGKDENGCPLEPVCVEEDSCTTDEDCKFLCGLGSCVEGKCQVAELTECKEAECTGGQTKINKCGTGEELTVEICDEGLWSKTGVECGGISEEIKAVKEVKEGGEEAVVNEEPISGDECSTRSDCGGEDDVCSNGRCITIPENAGGEVKEEPQKEESTEEGTKPEEEKEAPQESPSEEKTEEAPPKSEEPEASEAPPEEPSPEPTITGEVIRAPLKNAFGLFLGLFNKDRSITGFAVDEGGAETSEGGGDSGGSEETTEQTTETKEGVAESPPESEGDQESRGNNKNIEVREDQPEGGQDQGERYEERRDDRREEDNKKRCEDECGRTCYDNKVRPCVDECIRKECGEELNCDVDAARKACEGSCGEKEDVEGCKTDCVPKCTKGGDWWKEFQKQPEEDMHKEEKGVFTAGGQCRQAQGGKTEAFIWFGGWGDPFEKLQPLKQKYYSGGNADWCKQDFENLKKQREEFEKGFNEEFVNWFFEKYLANSADKWEQHVSGIFELYWKDVDISRQMAQRMDCIGVKEFPHANLINIKYESEYGSIEFWEELKKVKLPETEEVEIVSPYMKVWVFPSRDVIKLEMKKGMEKHKMPGPGGEEIGPSEEEKAQMRNEKEAMQMIKELSQKYGGSFDGVIQFKDYTTNEVVLNIYVKIDEENLISVEPMLPSEVPQEDARAELDFEILYDIIYTSEKEMRGIQTESPPWDKQKFAPVQKVKEIVNGVKMWLKGRELMGSAKYYPESSKEDMQPIMKEMLGGMFGGSGDTGSPEGEGPQEGSDEDKNLDSQGVWNDKKVVTGEVVLTE